MPIETVTHWSDAGTGWNFHNMNLYRGALKKGQQPRLGRKSLIPPTGKWHCPGHSGHPDAGAPLFHALDLPSGAWPVRTNGVVDGLGYSGPGPAAATPGGPGSPE